MTNAALGPVVRGVPLEELRSRLDRALRHIPPERHNRIFEEASKNEYKLWEPRLEKELEAKGFSSPGPRDRWLFFVRVMEPEMWVEIWAKYPLRAERLEKDYFRLRARALAGDFDEGGQK